MSEEEKMLECIIDKIKESVVSVDTEKAVNAYSLCGNYATAVEYLKENTGERYKLSNELSNKVPFDTNDYVRLAKEKVRKGSTRKIIRFIEESDKGEATEVLIAVNCNMDSEFAAALLKEALKEIKETMPTEDWSTNSVINLVVDHVYGDEAKFEILTPAFDIIF
jgi:hypothetical protein